MTTALTAMSLSVAASAIARGESSARELADAELAHIARVDPNIRAWASLDDNRVRTEAARCDRAHVQGRIAGIGVGIKDIIATAELPTEMGSEIFAGHQPSDDAACVTRLKNAGGYVFGKTVTTAFAFMDPGKTRNPWHAGHTPGGSSSGSAAAVAAGEVTVALGTQTNGSVIRPAAYCGVVGFKPTRGWTKYDGIFVFSETLDTLGTFTRSVADAAVIACVLADFGRISDTIALPARPPRIAYLGGFPWAQIECDESDALDAAATRLKQAGAEVAPVSLPDELSGCVRTHGTIMLFEGAQRLASIEAADAKLLPPKLAQALSDAHAIPPDDYAAAKKERQVAAEFAMRWLAPYDAILCPAAPSSAPLGLESTGDPSCCTLWSLVGFPAIALPIGLDAQKLPLGMQLATVAGAENRLLSVAQWCEMTLPFKGLV